MNDVGGQCRVILFTVQVQGMNEHSISALLLRFYHKKQENHAAISNRFSVDAANNAFKALTNFIPFIVT